MPYPYDDHLYLVNIGYIEIVNDYKELIKDANSIYEVRAELLDETFVDP
jgi:hypothetical protein